MSPTWGIEFSCFHLGEVEFIHLESHCTQQVSEGAALASRDPPHPLVHGAVHSYAFYSWGSVDCTLGIPQMVQSHSPLLTWLHLSGDFFPGVSTSPSSSQSRPTCLIPVDSTPVKQRFEPELATMPTLFLFLGPHLGGRLLVIPQTWPHHRHFLILTPGLLCAADSGSFLSAHSQAVSSGKTLPPPSLNEGPFLCPHPTPCF